MVEHLSAKQTVVGSIPIDIKMTLSLFWTANIVYLKIMYVSYATTLIKNWLQKNGCEFKYEASTGSNYFLYGNIKIRVSDHFTAIKNNVIYIFIASNKKQFGLFVDRMFYSFNKISELKAFLSSLFLILDGSFKNKLVKQHIEESSLQTKVQQLENKLNATTAQAEKWLNEKKELQAKVTKLELKLHSYKTQIKQLNSQII